MTDADLPENSGAGFPGTLDLALREGKRLNPLWLHGWVGGGRALHIRLADLDLGPPLGALYDSVEELACSGGARLDATLPFVDEAFDAVTAYGCVLGHGTLRECRRVLRPGGLALFATRNRWWYGRLRSGWRSAPGAVAGLGVARAMRRAGFRAVSTYMVAPGLTDPRMLVPATPSRVAGVETLLRHDGGRARLWSALARLGLWRTLLPALVFVGEA
jgi:SAM-dependent methyltransferase